MMQQMLDEAIRQTAQMINTEPTEVVLHRAGAVTRDQTGGVVHGPSSEVYPQMFYVAAPRGLPAWRVDDTGERLLGRIVLIGMPDADVEEGDWFMLSGRKHRVVYIYPDRSFQVKAEVERVTDGS